MIKSTAHVSHLKVKCTKGSPAGRLVTLALLCLVCVVTPDSLSGRRATFGRNGASALGVEDLRGGAVVADEIEGTASHTFKVNLSVGQRLRLTLAKGDLHASLSLFAPDGRRLAELIGRRYADLRLSHVAETPGAYRVELHSLEHDPKTMRYKLTVEEVRSVGQRERSENLAANVFAEAEGLRALWEKGAFERAAEKYADAAARWHALGRWREEAEALEGAADVHFILSDYRRALASYHGMSFTCRRAGDKLCELTAEAHAGYVSGYTDREGEALKRLRRVLDRLRAGGVAWQSMAARRAEVQALNALGEAHHSLGNLRQALQAFEQAHGISQELGDRQSQAMSLLNAGYIHADAGDLRKALESYREALALARACLDRRLEALSLSALGGVDTFHGEQQQALDQHKQAVELSRAIGDSQGEAVALNGLARVYEKLNELPTAVDNYTRALRLFERNGSAAFAASTQYAVAKAYRLMTRNEEALAGFRRSLSMFRGLGRRRMEAYVLMDMAAMSASSGERARALAQYRRGLKFYEEIGDRRGHARALLGIGDIHSLDGKLRESLSYYERALALSRSAEDRAAEAATLYKIAGVERDGGNLTVALSRIESTVEIIEQLRARVAHPTFRSSYFAAVNRYYDFYIDLLMRLHRQAPGAGYDARALQISESARARSLLESLQEAKANIRHGVAAPLLERASELEHLLTTRSQYQMRLQSGAEHADEAAEVRRELQRLTTEYLEVQSQIREQSPAYAALTQPVSLSLPEIQAELRGEDTLLLEFALGEQKSYLWAVTADSLESFELPPRAVIEASAQRLYALLVARQPAAAEPPAAYRERVARADAEYDAQAAALGEMLLGQVSARLGRRRLAVVADGALQYIPFEALPEPRVVAESGGPPSDNADPSEPLVLRHEVVSLPSASTLGVLRREHRGRAQAPKLVMVFADPVFELDDPRVAAAAAVPREGSRLRTPLRSASVTGGKAGVSRLPFALREGENIMAVARTGESVLASGFQARRATADGLGEYQIIHFATHGVIDDGRPELSGIVLGLVNECGEEENGFLQLHDIYNLNLNAELVVLSACDTGLGKNLRGEGMVGLTRGFMYAGSKRVVASLWKVDDRATAELMRHFYAAMLRDGLPPPAALRAAKEAMWRQPNWRAPFYWAAFVLQGEYMGVVKAAPGGEGKASVVLFSTCVLTLMLGSLYMLLRRARRHPRSPERRAPR